MTVPPRRTHTDFTAPRHWIVVTVVLFIVTVVLGFVIKLVPALGAAQLPLDAALNRSNTAGLDSIALALDKLDQPVVVGVILLVVFGVMWILKGWRRSLGIVVVAGAGWVTCLAVKFLVHQPRPDLADVPHQLVTSASTLSYPSGHVAFVAALGAALFMAVSRRAARVAILIVFAVLAVIVAASRLYVGVHYPTDTVGGVINGVAGALLFAGLWNLLAPRVFRTNRH
ncbi:MAG TPA: phosphatase PAP2 family protein [Pseudolysinimonas sp.]|nr:phosphatase PAP2 family protein [Pseudolysinimonas sp.]